ncbi:MAG: hydrogenase expression/formation protein HypE [Candidatus Omnitrophica bacterium]|nr:hydrogenase expression/formation protein HypE [Candidatus Omnitrophota bacterium]
MKAEIREITLAHGNGGKLMHELIEKLRIRLSNNILDELTDAAELRIKGRRLAFSTDSYVVKPLFFPGGDIGKLAVCGTVNDISMKGAKPLFLSLSFIIEEGLEFKVIEQIADSIKKEAKKAGVLIVTGDIKVVEKGACDKVYINTSGIGVIDYPKRISAKARVGDAIIINGSIAEHGMAILNARENLGFKSAIKSDCKSLNFEVERALSTSNNISVLRDPTRGGLATALNEIAEASNLGIEVYEKEIPVKRSVLKLCSILGFDPLYVANEGKFICFVNGKDAKRIKRAIGPKSKIIGKVTTTNKREVVLKTRIGSGRILPILETDQLPRIC